METRVCKSGKSILAFVLGLVLLVTIDFAVSARNHLSIDVFGRQWVAVDTTSLDSGIQVGALVMEHPIQSAKSLQAGDILSYTVSNDMQSSIIQTGRIQKVATRNGKSMVQMRSLTAAQVEVAWVPLSNIVGVYGGVEIPYVGYYFEWMQTQVGVLVLIVAPGVILMLMTFIRLIQEIMNLVPSNYKAEETTSFSVRPSTASYGLEAEHLRAR